MAKREELENGMELLKEMRGVIGQLIYAAQVKSLLKSLPVFKSFEKVSQKSTLLIFLTTTMKIMTPPIKTASL
jgi:hypothetical protein